MTRKRGFGLGERPVDVLAPRSNVPSFSHLSAASRISCIASESGHENAEQPTRTSLRLKQPLKLGLALLLSGQPRGKAFDQGLKLILPLPRAKLRRGSDGGGDSACCRAADRAEIMGLG